MPWHFQSSPGSNNRSLRTREQYLPRPDPGRLAALTVECVHMGERGASSSFVIVCTRRVLLANRSGSVQSSRARESEMPDIGLALTDASYSPPYDVPIAIPDEHEANITSPRAYRSPGLILQSRMAGVRNRRPDNDARLSHLLGDSSYPAGAPLASRPLSNAWNVLRSIERRRMDGVYCVDS